MANALEADGVCLKSANTSDSFANCRVSAGATCISGTDFVDSCTEFASKSNSLTYCKLNSEAPLVGINLVDNSLDSDSSKPCVGIPSMTNPCADHISDISYPTTDDLCSDQTSICDPTPAENCAPIKPETINESQTVQNCLLVDIEMRSNSKTVDSSPEDCGDLSITNDDSRFEDQEVVKEWLQGTVEHLRRIRGSSDENDFDVDLEIQDEETVEVQEFYEEEEIAEETIKSEQGTCSSTDEGDYENEEPMSYELQQGYKILREIMGNNNRSFTWPFVNPVDAAAEGCSDYYKKVNKPMWLMKMREKFERREYESITEYVADMRLMFENCYRYNGLNHPISRSGSKLEMMMEQKLQLLSRELREKTSLAATSGETFEMPLTSTRRLKQFPSGSMTVMHRLRYEAQEKEKEAKRQQQLDRKLAYEAMLRELDGWEDNLFKEPYRQQMKAMWELPQIGQFLFLCGKALNLAEVSQYELECCLLLPQQSSALQRIMTCFLSTPHQRARLQGKSLMPYRVWEEKLRQLLILWYKTYQDTERNAKKTVIKLGLDEKFFKVVGCTNPLEKKKFHELTFYQRVWILKSICDNCLEVQKSLNEVIESHPLHDQRATKLGSDNDGNEYIHFPQFCGEDLRIYRQIRPVVVYEETNKEKVASSRRLKRRHKHRDRSATKKSLLELPEPSASSSSSATPRIRDSRLRQNPRQVQSYKVMDSSTSSDSEGTSDDQEDDEEEEEKKEEKEDEAIEGDEQEEEEKTEKEMQLEEEEKPVEEKHPEAVKEVEEAIPKVVRSSRRRIVVGKMEVKSAELENCFDLYDSKHPRRSVRKVLEESMKDAMRCTLPSTDRNQRRRSSVSSCSSLSLSRSGQEQSYGNGLKSPPGKRGTRSVEKDERKGELSSEEDETDVESVSLTVTSPRLTRSRAQSKIKSNNSVSRSKTGSVSSNQKFGLRPFDVGRITRNLYKSLLEEEKEAAAVAAANGNCNQSQVNDVVETRGRKGGRQKKRSCLTIVSSMTDVAGCGGRVSNCGDASTGPEDAKVVTSPKEAACNGHDAVADVGSCVESVSSYVGQGDCHWTKGDPAVKMEVNEEVTLKVKQVPSELVSGESIVSDEPLPLEKTPRDFSMEDKSVTQKSMSHGATGEFKSTSANSVNSAILDFKAADLKPVLGQKAEQEVSKCDETIESLPLVTKEEVLEKADAIKTDIEEKTENQPTDAENVIKVKKEDEDEVCEILGPDTGEFELVVDGIQGLRQLIEKFADKEDDEDQQDMDGADTDPRYRKRCTIALHERLLNLLEEVEKHEQHLLNFKKKKMIRLRKEQENYREEPEREQSISPWPPQEETAKSEARTDEGKARRSLRQTDRREKSISQRSVHNRAAGTESISGEFSFQRPRRSLHQLYRQKQAEDIWENNDSTSCASNADATNDECSVDAESSSSRVEDKPAVQKKPRPSRKRTAVDAALLGASPSMPTSESAPATPTSTVSTRKRTATAQGSVQSAKRSKKKNSCVENVQTAANPNSEVTAATPGSSHAAGLSTPLSARNSLIRGLINAGVGAARMKLASGAQPNANLTSDVIRNQLLTTSLASYISQQANRFQARPQRSMAASSNLMARLAGSLPLATANSSSFASRRSAGSVPQASPRVNVGQVLQPYIEQGVLRLASPSGSGMQFLAVSNISQLPPGLLQQLVSNQGLRMVTPSGSAHGHTAVATNTVAPSTPMSNCLFVPRPALGVTTQDIHLSNNAQPPRTIASQNLVSLVGQSRVSQTNQNYLPSFRHAAGTALSAVSAGFTVCSQPSSSGILTTSSKFGLPLVKPMQCLPSIISASSSIRPLFGQGAQTSSAHPLLKQNVPISLPALDSAARQRYTNNLTVRALLGNRSALDQIGHLYPGSGDEVDIASSLSNIGRLVASSENVAMHPVTGSLAASHLIADMPSESMLREYGCTNTHITSAFGVIVSSIMSSSQSHSLSVLGNQRPVLCPPDMLSSGLCFKMGDISSGGRSLEPGASKPGISIGAIPTDSITGAVSKQLQHSLQPLQVMGQTSIGSKIIILPQEAIVSGASGIRQLLAGDHPQQPTVFLTSEQVAAMTHLNRAKPVINTSINASLPLVDIKIVSSLVSSPHTTGLGTQTTTVLKSPIPSLPPLTNSNILPNKPVIRSAAAALLSPTSSGKALSFIPVHFSQGSNIMPISSSALPLPASVPSAATAPMDVRANVPVVFNSAIMMRGAQNVFVLQQAPVQVLSFDRNAPALNNTPLKISLNIPQSIPSSVSNIAPHAAQLLNPCKVTQAPCASIGSSGQLSQHQSIPHLTLPGLTMPNRVVVTQAAQNVAVSQHAFSTHELAPSRLLLSPEQSAVNQLGQSLSIPCQLLQLPSAGNQPNPRLADAPPAAASSNLQILAAQASSSRPILPVQKCGLVIQQNMDGACLGQLPLEEIAKRVRNRFSARLVTVSPPNGSTPSAGNNEPQVSSIQMNSSKTQLHGVRLLSNASVVSLGSELALQPSALTVLPTSEKRPANVLQTTPTAAVATQLPVRNMTLPMNKIDGVRMISGADAARILQSRSRALQPSQRQPILPVQASNLNRPTAQLAVPTNISTLPLLRNQVVQLAVQPSVPVMHDGRVHQPMSASSASSQVIRILQQAQLQSLSQETPRYVSSLAIHPPNQPSRVATHPGFSMSDPVRMKCMATVSNSLCSVSSSSVPCSNPALSNVTQSTSGLMVRPSIASFQSPSNTGMNLDLASLLQAASVVDNSANEGCDSNILNLDSMYDGQPTS